MSLDPIASNPKKDGSLSILWAILYLALHQLAAQAIIGNNVFLILRVAFVMFLVVVLLIQRDKATLQSIFLGHWLRGRREWMRAFGFILAVAALRFAESWLFHFRPSPLTLEAFIMEAIVPPINEEIVFRGIILGSVIAYAPHRPAMAIVLSSLIFVGCHHLGNPVPLAFIVALFSQSLLYGICYVWTRCLPLCILLHGLWNSLLWLFHGAC
jgi:membrane protease YdiL (CAAX protease family)